MDQNSARDEASLAPTQTQQNSYEASSHLSSTAEEEMFPDLSWIPEDEDEDEGLGSEADGEIDSNESSSNDSDDGLEDGEIDAEGEDAEQTEVDHSSEQQHHDYAFDGEHQHGESSFQQNENESENETDEAPQFEIDRSGNSEMRLMGSESPPENFYTTSPQRQQQDEHHSAFVRLSDQFQTQIRENENGEQSRGGDLEGETRFHAAAVGEKRKMEYVDQDDRYANMSEAKRTRLHMAKFITIDTTSLFHQWVRDHFGKFGNIVDISSGTKADLLNKQKQKKCMTFTTIHFDCPFAARKASSLHGQTIDGLPIRVSHKKELKDQITTLEQNFENPPKPQIQPEMPPFEEDKIRVTNIPIEATLNDLQSIFAQCGEIVHLRLSPHQNKKLPLTQIAFITFATKEAVPQALGLNGIELFGQKLLVQQARMPRRQAAPVPSFASFSSAADGSSQAGQPPPPLPLPPCMVSAPPFYPPSAYYHPSPPFDGPSPPPPPNHYHSRPSFSDVAAPPQYSAFNHQYKQQWPGGGKKEKGRDFQQQQQQKQKKGKSKKGGKKKQQQKGEKIQVTVTNGKKGGGGGGGGAGLAKKGGSRTVVAVPTKREKVERTAGGGGRSGGPFGQGFNRPMTRSRSQQQELAYQQLRQADSFSSEPPVPAFAGQNGT